MLLRCAIGMCTAGILFVMLGQAGADQAEDDIRGLLLHEKGLGEKVERLKQEQEFLLFKKEFYASDSKYLILDLASKTGQLRYKNRLLKEFHFIAASPRDARGLPRGIIILTKKIGSDHNRLTLIFGKSLIMKIRDSRQQAVRKGETPTLYLKKGDIISLFYALEVGSRAYVLRQSF